MVPRDEARAILIEHLCVGGDIDAAYNAKVHTFERQDIELILDDLYGEP